MAEAAVTSCWSDLALRFGREPTDEFKFSAFLSEVFPGFGLRDLVLAFEMLKPGQCLQCDWEDPSLPPRHPAIQDKPTYHTTHLSFLKKVRMNGLLAMNPGAMTTTPSLYTSPLLNTSMRYRDHHGKPVRAPLGISGKTLIPVFIIDGNRAGRFRRRGGNHQVWYGPGNFTVLGIRFECESGECTSEAQLRSNYCDGSKAPGKKEREFSRRLRSIESRGYLVESKFRAPLARAQKTLRLRGSVLGIRRKDKASQRRARKRIKKDVERT